MKYMLLIYADEAKVPQTAEEQKAAAPAWYAFAKEAETAGVLVSNNGLCPVADATTVRIREGKTLITDGPFAETHERLGGYYIFDCTTLDEVLAWAAKIPTVMYGSIEVRPLNQWSQK
jgi:hypothetical protein